jgi:hypothetical protein
MTRASSLAFLALWIAAHLGSTRAGVAPDGEATQVHGAKPGDVYRGSIAIRNTGPDVMQVKLYQTDYRFAADGSNDFGAPATQARSNAAWIRLNREQLTVGPMGVASVDYEVRVPAEASLTGTYWSVVMVQELPAAEASGSSRGGVRLSQTVRHAIQLITEIGDAARSDLMFRNARLVEHQGMRELEVDLENTGERWLRTDLWIELHDAQGRFAGRFTARRCRTFPGTSVRNRIALAQLPDGKYLALLVADGGRNDLFGTQLELDLR